MTSKNDETPSAADFGATIGKLVFRGSLACAVLVFGFGGWAAIAKLSGAVVTTGRVVVASDLSVVQHPDGGVISAIHVKNGDRVTAGDIVVDLDDSLLRASNDLLNDELIALEARMARLMAERDGQDTLSRSEMIDGLSDQAAVATAFSAQAALMQARRETREGEIAALDETVEQLKKEIEGLEAQRAANAEQLRLVAEELEDVEKLFAEQLVPQTRVTSLQRTRADLQGESGSMLSEIAVANERIAGAELQKVQIAKTAREEIVEQLSTLIPQIAQLRDQRAVAELRLSRAHIAAPKNGVIHQLDVHTIGEVVQPGATLMKIVPESDQLEVSARVAPVDVDQVHVGQDVTLVMSAFDAKTTPKMDGAVSFVSAELDTDPNTGIGYFEVRVAFAASATQTLKDMNLAVIPGMPVEVDIQTEERTVATYLLEPLANQIRNTFREP